MLIDTTLLIDFLRGKREAITFLEEKEKQQQLYTTEINVFELVMGVYAKKQEPQIETEKIFALLSRFIVLPLERRGVIKAGEIAGGLIKSGNRIEETDCLIAGIALANGITEIITANKEHYERIKELKVISY